VGAVLVRWLGRLGLVLGSAKFGMLAMRVSRC
jgi:hypothetical protein